MDRGQRFLDELTEGLPKFLTGVDPVGGGTLKVGDGCLWWLMTSLPALLYALRRSCEMWVIHPRGDVLSSRD